MAGIGNNATAMGDWMPPSPSHINFFSNLMAEEFDLKSFSNRNEGPLLKLDERENIVNTKEEEKGGAVLHFSTDLQSKINSVHAHKPSLTERRAARAGFNAPTIDTDQIRAANFSSSSSDIRSPYLTIPPGLSPTTLLDSPVFLSNSLAQPSPTTGTFSFPQCNTDSFLVGPDKTKDHPLEGIGPQSSDVKPPDGSDPFSFSSGGHQPVSTIDPHQTLPCTGGSFQNSKEINLSVRELSIGNVIPNQRLSNLTTGKECSPPPDNSQEEEKGESSLALGAPAEDGYNWRKYGQKHVKGSEYPRSYYKCTNPQCPVKKKVERNHEGQVTEIIYKGAHNHPKPPPNRRSGVLSSHPFNDYQSDGHDWRSDSGLDAAPPASGATEFGETQEAGEVSSTLSNEENEEDRLTHGSVSVGCDGEGEETESKRRKLDVCPAEMSAGSRAVREPRVVVQTTSEVDILDDGYRWRKYGQKVVKGNPNPRSYYKCTNPGCSVRKHVERASHDLKSVITTYEGKHNHEVPAARGGSGSTSSSLPASAAPVAPQPARAQDSFKRYNGPPPLAAFSLHGRDQIAPGAANFAFGVGPQSFSAANLAMSRFSHMALPSVNALMGHHRHGADAGFVVPKGEPTGESLSDPSLNMSNGASAYYHQLMGRMSLGPQL